MNTTFKITIHDLYWINGVKDDPKDLCLHGHLTVQIGNTILEDHGTVSASTLYLLKTLTEDKIMSKYDIQMIPCCGHFMIANHDLTEVQISGCDNGTDWSIIHEKDNIKIILPNGEYEFIPFDVYKKEVFNFVDKIEAFYLSCTPKELPKDEFDKNGYIAFWNEWKRRRNQEKSL